MEARFTPGGDAMGRTWKAVLLICVFAVGTDPASPQGAKIAPPQFEIDLSTGSVVRRDKDGTTAWSAPLHRVLGVTRATSLLWHAHRVKSLLAEGVPVVYGARDFPLLWDMKRLYVWDEQGVTALSTTTGIVLWHADGPMEDIVLNGGLLLVLGKHLPDGRWLTVRAVTTGAEVRKVHLRAGVITALPRGKDWLFLNSKGVVGSSPGDKESWMTPFDEREWPTDGGLVEAGNGDVVAFRYCCIADSGVQLIRLNTATGKVMWGAKCARLGVGHSKYRHHATVTLDGQTLRVTSRGSYGMFVEVLDLRTGKQLKRTRSES
jgi:hypothetical protein